MASISSVSVSSLVVVSASTASTDVAAVVCLCFSFLLLKSWCHLSTSLNSRRESNFQSGVLIEPGSETRFRDISQ